jgi:tetratricopeptide (TPR) repeat protein
VLSFHHALVQDVAYGRLLRRHRRDLHRRVAETAEELYGAGDDVIDLLARHLYLGEAGDKAVEYLVRAGGRAKRLFANEEAIVHFGRAAELSSDPEIVLQLADLHELVGDYDDALGEYERVRAETGDIRAWRGLASTHRKRGEHMQAFMTVNDAFSADELRGQDLTPLWVEQGWSLYNTGKVEEAIDVLQAGIAAQDSRVSVGLGHLLVHLSNAEMLAGRLDEALEHALAAQALMERYDDLRGLASAIRVTGGAYRLLDRLDEAAATLRRGLGVAERIGSVEEIGGCLINLGAVELARGSVAEAIECDRRAIAEFERVGHGTGRAIGYANLAGKLIEAGEYDEAVAMCERAQAVARSIGHAMTLAETTDTLALVELRRGRPDEAARRAEEAAEQFLELGAPLRASEALTFASDAWEQADEVERARLARGRARSLVSPS